MRISGSPALPPIEYFGFHFSKYERDVGADRLAARNDQFNQFEFPVDSLWLDIYHTAGFRYFNWDRSVFQPSKVDRMNRRIHEDKRRIVAITDPHIKVDPSFEIYDKVAKESLAVKTCDGLDFQGESWPGSSVWFDFLNQQAREYWASLYTAFPQTEGYGFWIDMNEPAVSNSHQQTIPPSAVHRFGNGTSVLHRDVHNMYSLLMQSASYEGLLLKSPVRPFLLTRSFFIGSQKYGAWWTGDNRAQAADVSKALQTLLAGGVSGLVFGGADVPGFQGQPSNEVWAMFYQLGTFFPFFRAHCFLQNTKREPWL